MVCVIGLMLPSLALAAHHGETAVQSTVDDRVDFGALHTYSWAQGNSAFYRDPDELIVAAFDAEMSRKGFTRAEGDPDVTISYFTVASTYVDLERLHGRLAPDDAAPTRTRSTLAIIMRRGDSSQPIWTATTREFLDPDPAQLGETIRRVAARLFESYPHERSAGR
jgi:hypothetical protein